jgi:pimeloyl-ACP methyl ester carboxylesterase
MIETIMAHLRSRGKKCGSRVPQGTFAGGLLAASAIASPMHSQSTDRLDWKPATLSSTAGERFSADTARLIVPERHDRATGGRVSLPLLRIRGTRAVRAVPIIYLAGGPGVSGLSTARGEILPVLLALRAQGDVYVYDQRGTGQAQPSLTIDGTLDLPVDVAVDHPTSRARLKAVADSAVVTMRARGIDLSAYTTEASVADLEAIRRAIGAERIIIWGHSYGSHLAFAYLRRFEGRVDRLVVSGVNGPDQRRRLPSDGDRFLSRVDSIVRTTPRLGRLQPDFLESLRRSLLRLESVPGVAIVDGRPVHVGAPDVRVLIAVASGERTFVSLLPQLVADLAVERYDAIARQVLTYVKQRAIGTAMSYTMDLASGTSPERAERIRREEPTALLRNAINFPFSLPELAAAWQVPPMADEWRSPLRSAVPALFISGTLDGRTSLTDAAAVRSGFSNSGHLVLRGAAHSPYALSPVVREHLVAFVDGASPTGAVIDIDPELRSPDEARQVARLQAVALRDGVEAAASLMRSMARDSLTYLTSFVPGNLFFALRQAGQPAAAAALLDVGSSLFPDNVFLLLRRAELATARGDRRAATVLYERVLELDPLNLAARARRGQ